jgi:plastocyanin domain-containing protein
MMAIGTSGAAARRRAQSTRRRVAFECRVSKLQVQQQKRLEYTRKSPSPCQNRIFSFKFGQLKQVFSTLNFDFKVRSTQSPNL